MGMLDRYKKPGGLVQLITLIETCGEEKQNRFLEMISNEDPIWTDAILKKMLSFKKILSWSDEVLVEILSQCQDLTLGFLYQGVDKAQQERFLKLCPNKKKRVLQEAAENGRATQQEIYSSKIKLIELVRKLSRDGVLRFENFDQDLYIGNELEKTLLEKRLNNTKNINSSQNETGKSHESGLVTEIQKLRKKNAELIRDNNELRSELATVKSKLNQIKKMA